MLDTLIISNNFNPKILNAEINSFATPIHGTFTNFGVTLENPTPLQLACLFKRPNFVFYLGRYVNINDPSTFPPLFISILMDDVQTIYYLAQFPLDRSVMYNGMTALHFALRNNRTNVFNYLLSLGFDPFAFDVNGDAAIHTAVKMDNYDAICTLGSSLRISSNGESITQIKNREGLNARELAQKIQNDKDRIKELRERVTMLEKAVQVLYQKIPEESFNKCCECDKRGMFECPVCHNYFCSSDWKTHVYNGCKAKC